MNVSSLVSESSVTERESTLPSVSVIICSYTQQRWEALLTRLHP